MAIQAVIHKKFGDRIMSAIDFIWNTKKEDTKGDRIRIMIMSGEFLQYQKW